MTALEGPFWVNIRGLGLAYGYSIIPTIASGLLTFSLFKSSNVIQAYEVSHEIIDDFLTKKIEIHDILLEAAKSGVISATFEKEANVESAALQVIPTGEN